MKYPQILELLTASPLLITPEARQSLLTLFEQHATMSAEDFKAAREGTGVCGEKIELDCMTIDDNGVAHIPIGGPLGLRLGGFEKGAGAVDYLDLQRELVEADANPDVKAAILHFDSPGGTVSGTPETADVILDFEKPIYAFSNGGMMASAAYWLASATDGIMVTKSATVGSIGVYTAYLDLSQMAAQRGIKVKMFSSGKYKGMGAPGTSLSAAQSDYIQETVMSIATNFYDHVRERRPGVPDEAMQGQVFRGQASVNAGLVDEIVADVDALTAFLS